MEFLFGKQKSPADRIKEYNRSIKKSVRELDRERATLERNRREPGWVPPPPEDSAGAGSGGPGGPGGALYTPPHARCGAAVALGAYMSVQRGILK